MSIVKPIYNVFRSIIMTLIVLLVIVYVGLYIILSVPSVQNKVKDKVCREMSTLLGGKLNVESLTIQPFSEVILTGTSLLSPEGDKCAEIRKVAAGIDLWALLIDRKIIINYAEIIGLDVNISQKAKQGPLNIQFLIDALSPKDKNKPSALFNLRIRNIVVRDSKARYSRLWMADSSGVKQPFADVDLSRLRMDLSIPILKNEHFKFDIRNLQFEVSPGINLRSLTAEIEYLKGKDSISCDSIKVKDFELNLPKTSLAVGDFEMCLDSLMNVHAIVEGKITPSDFAALVPKLNAFDTPFDLGIDAIYKDKELELNDFQLYNNDSNSKLTLEGNASNFQNKDSLDISIRNLQANLASQLIAKVASTSLQINEKSKGIIDALGNIHLDIVGNLQHGNAGEAKGLLETDCGKIDFTASGNNLLSKLPTLAFDVNAYQIELDKLLMTDKIGQSSFHIDGEITGLDKDAEGHVFLASDESEVFGINLTGLEIDLKKSHNDVGVTLDVKSSDNMAINLEAGAFLAGQNSRFDADLSVEGIRPANFGLKGEIADCKISGKVATNIFGNNIDNIAGVLEMNDLSIVRANGNILKLNNLTVDIDSLHQPTQNGNFTLTRDIKLSSDWINAHVNGEIKPSTLISEIKSMIGKVFPTFAPSGLNLNPDAPSFNDFSFDVNIKGVAEPYDFFNTPVRPLTDIHLIGDVDSRQGKASLKTGTPHLQQGKNKLIRNLKLDLGIDSNNSSASMFAGMIYPAKKGDVEIASDIFAANDNMKINIGLNPKMKSSLKGNILLETSFSRMPSPYNPAGELAVGVEIIPSTITISDKVWSIASGGVDYFGKRIAVNNFLISHQDQYVKIDGVASERSEDNVKVRLNDIDLEYIFNMLNINYVTFGGMATGEVVGSRLLTKRLDAKTEYLHVKNLSYNGAVLGDGDLASEYDIAEQKVGIYGVIRDPLTRERRASVDGGVWVTRDSLSFSFDANKVNVGIMRPFVSAFCSDLNGSASGKCKLYGTFSDIDLVGSLKADTISMKLDFTNTWYHAGNDSVYLHKGLIDVPALTLYDTEGHTAEFSGWLRHTYFHEPVFNFRIKDARSLLCYDTNETMNPLWYGTVYGSGHGQISGRPGLVDIDLNMTTEEGSKFYYIISDAEDVDQYSFLTFTDKRKEIHKAAVTDTIPEYLQKFQKQKEEMEEGSSNVIVSLKGTVTQEALVTLVMDPKAGDNITARGQGALQMDYNLASNDLRMIGTYVLDEGNYNFTLQDIIIKNFNIRKGSLIKFDGDPMNANLDIAATYRVNTNLTDLDKSFATDKELNRTNVPVDALLLVKGPMTNPDITFDIELPSLTSDVERKVKSIVSTNDMMSRQIIYLLALNRFYTPEYTGGQSNGSEWSSMASSTLSSQLSNILSQMTDKLDVAPSFRSEKGDFTDMEFDLALSSRLLNNRLLINGNFGYRDKNTSNTQFVGDFDIEYLLNKSGNLRLKAYNHFNDQNYYLRSALTTQGVGVVFQRDFDHLFGRKKKEKEIEIKDEEVDTLMIKPSDKMIDN